MRFAFTHTHTYTLTCARTKLIFSYRSLFSNTGTWKTCWIGTPPVATALRCLSLCSFIFPRLWHSVMQWLPTGTYLGCSNITLMQICARQSMRTGKSKIRLRGKSRRCRISAKGQPLLAARTYYTTQRCDLILYPKRLPELSALSLQIGKERKGIISVFVFQCYYVTRGDIFICHVTTRVPRSKLRLLQKTSSDFWLFWAKCDSYSYSRHLNITRLTSDDPEKLRSRYFTSVYLFGTIPGREGS